MKPRKAAAAAWVLAWATLLIYTGVFGTYRVSKDFEADAEISRLSGEVRALESANAELEIEQRRQRFERDECLRLRLRVDRELYDEHGVMIEVLRLDPPRPGCFEGRRPGIANLVVRDGKLILDGRHLVIR